jgi:hypothetical protein
MVNRWLKIIESLQLKQERKSFEQIIRVKIGGRMDLNNESRQKQWRSYWKRGASGLVSRFVGAAIYGREFTGCGHDGLRQMQRTQSRYLRARAIHLSSFSGNLVISAEVIDDE